MAGCKMTCAQKGMLLFRAIVLGYVAIQLAIMGYAVVNVMSMGIGIGIGTGFWLPMAAGVLGTLAGAFTVLFPVELIYRVHQKTCCCSKGESSCSVNKDN